LSNAPADTSPERLAWLKWVRHFVERSNQDAKSEIGWDELQAQKFRAGEHHLAMTLMATWFMAQTKYDWAQT
jgi:SRSO17 transposase